MEARIGHPDDAVEADSIVSLDVDPIVEAVSRLFGHHVVLSCGPAQGARRLDARSVGGILIGRLQYASDFACMVDQPRRHLVLTIPDQCGGHMGASCYSQNDVLAFNVDWCGRLDLSPPGSFLNSAISAEQVSLGFRALYGFEPEAPVRFAERLVGNSPAAIRAQQVIRLLHADHGGSALLQKVRAQWAVLELLSSWPHSHTDREPDSRVPSSMVRRAVEYINVNLDQPISLVDVALAMDVGLRALTSAFRKHLGETPGRYMRARRLDSAKAMLDANPALTVMEAATHWQFSNPGMFSRYFQMRFGYLPGMTRRRSSFNGRH
jgi:AraC-like DNA-binding protein